MVKWLKSNELVDYDYAINFMESRASEIASNKKKELIWLVEHPSILEGRLRKKKTCWIKIAFRYIARDAVANSLTTDQVNGSHT